MDDVDLETDPRFSTLSDPRSDPRSDRFSGPPQDSPTIVGSLVALLAIYEVAAFTVNRILDEPVIPSSLAVFRRFSRSARRERKAR